MVRYDAAYEVSFQFVFNFFATDNTAADEIANTVVEDIFGTSAFGTLQQVTGPGSATPLSGQLVSGNNYSYVYTYYMPVGDTTTPTYQPISADDPDAAVTAINKLCARATGLQNIVPKLNYLKLTP